MQHLEYSLPWSGLGTQRNLSVFRPVRFGRNVTVGEMMEEDAGLPWRYGVCVLAGLAVMVWVRRKETEGGR